MRITSKGQVTIPIEIRTRLGLLPGTEVEWDVASDVALLRRARASPRRGLRLVQRLRGRGDVPLRTDEILKLTRG